MTDKLIGCVQHDCEKCKERESSCNEAHRLAQLRFERIAELEAKLAAMESQEADAVVGFSGPIHPKTGEMINLPIGTKIYLASGAAQKEEPDALGLFHNQAHTDLGPATRLKAAPAAREPKS